MLAPAMMIRPRMMWYFIAPCISCSSCFSTPALLLLSCMWDCWCRMFLALWRLYEGSIKAPQTALLYALRMYFVVLPPRWRAQQPASARPWTSFQHPFVLFRIMNLLLSYYITSYYRTSFCITNLLLSYYIALRSLCLSLSPPSPFLPKVLI